MLKFLKYLLASFIGCFFALFLLFLIMAGMMGAVSSLSDMVTVEEKSVLKINLNAEIAERTRETPFPLLDYMNPNMQQTLGLNAILSAIKKAETDDRIEGILLNVSEVYAGISQLEEIRNALTNFKQSGKFILSYSDMYTQKSYYLATVADKVYINPLGDFQWKGLSAQMPFLKNMLDKLDIEVQVIRHGKYKSAVEPLMQESMSPENREQTLSCVKSVWNCMTDKIAEARNLSAAQLNEWADRLEIYDTRTALDKGLVDGRVYYDTVLEELKEKTGVASTDDIHFITLPKYIKYNRKLSPADRYGRQKIAVIYAEGNIVMGDGRNGITSEGLSNAIRSARQDSAVKAIVLRINSGGGSALASEIIAREISLADKPVIASFSDVAASGGYYIAAFADTIIANRTTLTGSIGVWGYAFNFKKFMNKKIGLTFDGAGTHRHSDFPNPMRPLHPEERSMLQRSVENVYDVFLERVAEGRQMTKDAVDKIAQGRVWNAVDAQRTGLVDTFGGLTDAIRIAAEKAGVDNYSVEELPRLQGTLEMLMSSLSEELRLRIIPSGADEAYGKYYRQIQNIMEMNGVQAMLPFEIEWH
ncbi:MAG: signal peptide peptidase SppA [Bacteroidales bacterium]|jgi:protease-4|nr:signal peptide peptidase SppA [Bacteroidales bacterium]